MDARQLAAGHHGRPLQQIGADAPSAPARANGEVLITAAGAPLDWRASLAVRNHWPTGPAWAYGGSGSGPAPVAPHPASGDRRGGRICRRRLRSAARRWRGSAWQSAIRLSHAQDRHVTGRLKSRAKLHTRHATGSHRRRERLVGRGDTRFHGGRDRLPFGASHRRHRSRPADRRRDERRAGVACRNPARGTLQLPPDISSAVTVSAVWS